MATKPEQDTATPAIYAQLQVLMGLVEPIAKADSPNGAVKYKYRRIDDVINDFHDKLKEAKILVIPTVIEKDYQTFEIGSNRTTMNFCRITVKYTLLCTLDGSFIDTAILVGEANDSGDKATGKALSTCYKYMLGQTFCIPFADDVEADSKPVANSTNYNPAPPKPASSSSAPEKPWLNEPALTHMIDFIKDGKSGYADVIGKAANYSISKETQGILAQAFVDAGISEHCPEPWMKNVGYKSTKK